MLHLQPEKKQNNRSQFNGPFVYRLGLQIFILARGVRFPYGLLLFKEEYLYYGKSQVSN